MKAKRIEPYTPERVELAKDLYSRNTGASIYIGDLVLTTLVGDEGNKMREAVGGLGLDPIDGLCYGRLLVDLNEPYRNAWGGGVQIAYLGTNEIEVGDDMIRDALRVHDEPIDVARFERMLDTVSPVHLRLTIPSSTQTPVEGSAMFVTDLGSTHGTFRGTFQSAPY